MSTSFFKLGLVTVALIAASGCAHLSYVSYPLNPVPPRDMLIVADNNERGLIVTLNMTNAVPLASASFLIDGRGRRYALHLVPIDALKDRPLCPRFLLTASGPIPSDSGFRFGEGLYIISIAYTKAGSARHEEISRAFIINRQSLAPPMNNTTRNGH